MSYVPLKHDAHFIFIVHVYNKKTAVQFCPSVVVVVVVDVV